MKFLFTLFFLVAFPATSFADILWHVPQKVSQGSGFVVTFESNQAFAGKVLWLDKEIPIKSSKMNSDKFESEVLLGMPIDSNNFKEVSFVGQEQGKTPIKKQSKITVLPVKWQSQTLKVEPKYVTPPKEVLNRIEKERKIRAPIMAHIDPEKKWKLPLYRPVKGIVTSPYGARRVFNDIPKAPHLGVDFRGATGNIIGSVADGIVVLVDDHYYAGKSVIVDHGQGVLSFYAHLSAYDVKVGEKVKRGQKVGRIGATGRVTGPHLHLSLYIQGIPVDFMTLSE